VFVGMVHTMRHCSIVTRTVTAHMHEDFASLQKVQRCVRAFDGAKYDSTSVNTTTRKTWFKCNDERGRRRGHLMYVVSCFDKARDLSTNTGEIFGRCYWTVREARTKSVKYFRNCLPSKSRNLVVKSRAVAFGQPWEGRNAVKR
jgi:hypothetical protein